MKELLSIQSIDIELFLTLFVPGFISLKIYDQIIPSGKRDFSKSILEVVSFSCINFALFYPLIIYLHQVKFSANHQVLYRFIQIIILLIAPVVWPFAWYKLTTSKLLADIFIHPIPKAWDFYFKQGNSCWVIVHLKDGIRIGGVYFNKSFVSSYPYPEEIYLEQVWELDNKGVFIKRIDRSKGIIIPKEEIKFLEFFENK